MRYFIAVVHKDEDSVFGVHFPDLPGCFSAADTLDEVVPKAAEALALYAEDMPLPEPRSLDALRKDKDVAVHLADGAMLVAVPYIEDDARVERPISRWKLACSGPSMPPRRRVSRHGQHFSLKPRAAKSNDEQPSRSLIYP